MVVRKFRGRRWGLSRDPLLQIAIALYILIELGTDQMSFILCLSVFFRSLSEGSWVSIRLANHLFFKFFRIEVRCATTAYMTYNGNIMLCWNSRNILSFNNLSLSYESLQSPKRLIILWVLAWSIDMTCLLRVMIKRKPNAGWYRWYTQNLAHPLLVS